MLESLIIGVAVLLVAVGLYEYRMARAWELENARPSNITVY